MISRRARFCLLGDKRNSCLCWRKDDEKGTNYRQTSHKLAWKGEGRRALLTIMPLSQFNWQQLNLGGLEGC